ncbi:MAG: GntR family transcriptional regulator [Actinomycetota bacterium]|nr:GntR family transcriptional regulator [Actinomycetota bacterium]
MARRPAQEITDALRSEILAGRLRPGDQVPSEHELARQFSTTRTSAQKAIAALRAEGHLVSEHGRGSFVRTRPTIRLLATGSNYRQRRGGGGQSNFEAEAAAQGMRAERRVLEVAAIQPPRDIAERLGRPGEEVVIVRRQLFFVDNEPMQLADGYYPADLATGTPIEQPDVIPQGSLAVIEASATGRRVVQFVEDLDIRMPAPSEAATLNIPPGVPVARVLRTAYDTSGTAVEVLDSILPADRYLFRYVIDVP